MTMKLYSQPYLNPHMIETSNKGRTIARIFIFDDTGIILETNWFKKQHTTNSSHKEVHFNYDKPVKNKQKVDFTKEKIFTTNTTDPYALERNNGVDLYIHNDIAQFKLSHHSIHLGSVYAIHKNPQGLEMQKIVDKLDKKSSDLQNKIYALQKEMDENKYNLEKFNTLCKKFTKLYKQKLKALDEEKILTEEAKIHFNIK